MEDTPLMRKIVDIEKKKSRKLKRLQQISFQKLKKKCYRDFFMKIQTNCRVSQVGRAFFTPIVVTEELALLVWFSIKYIT